MQIPPATSCSPVSQRFLRIVGLVLWGTALGGILQVHHLSGTLPFGWSRHTICGPWGCGPPLAALVSYHGFWLILLLPIGWLTGKAWLGDEVGRASIDSPDKNVGENCKARRLRLGGLVLVVSSLSLLVGIVAVDAARWLATSPTHSYLIQRVLFRVVTLVDLPLIPLAIVGALWLWQGRRRYHPPHPRQPAVQPLG